MATAHVVNGTFIVPYDFPTTFRPDQQDKLGFVGAITLAWPTIIGGIALMLSARDWRRYSYSQLSIFWMWSVSLVAFGIFTRFGVFDHFVIYLAVVHIQTEWLVITYLLGHSFGQAYINATIAGLVFYASEVAFPGIRAAFAVTSIGGGFGDVFIPVLLWHGGQHILAIGAIAHFLNALVTFVEFIQYLPLELYLLLQVVFGTAHAVFTVSGILRIQSAESPVRLTNDPEGANLLASCKSGHGHQRHPSDGFFKPLIAPPDMKTTIKLGLIALGLSLVASLPLNFLLNVHENLLDISLMILDVGI